ncbi:Hypothetical Protein FCC1311_092712 [Hondaea fermentalgiana]|uniref:Uncharacterized protein n=1 Tax=Hondaea fermentalgiana TaxID=2315210 RepID=A0A2R5GQA5_9STRA|nr:Hypothetical Protein FCC1311_092712 [Hondaea fermentalgiana]|eukprot:GBG33047.1 Hypothetical Protein FCC1311_092712 [Hondaea fermentalgiana]
MEQRLDPLKLLQKVKMVDQCLVLPNGSVFVITAYNSTADTFTVRIGNHPNTIDVGADALAALMGVSAQNAPSSSPSTAPSLSGTPPPLPMHHHQQQQSTAQPVPQNQGVTQFTQAHLLNQVKADLQARVSGGSPAPNSNPHNPGSATANSRAPVAPASSFLSSSFLQSLFGSGSGANLTASSRDQTHVSGLAPASFMQQSSINEWVPPFSERRLENPLANLGLNCGVGGASGFSMHRSQYGNLVQSSTFAPYAWEGMPTSTPSAQPSSLFPTPVHSTSCTTTNNNNNTLHPQNGAQAPSQLPALTKRSHAAIGNHDAILLAETYKRPRTSNLAHTDAAPPPPMFASSAAAAPSGHMTLAGEHVANVRAAASVPKVQPARNTASAAKPSQGNTKTEIFAQVHSCYRPSDGPKGSESTVPTYAEIENKLALDNNINAARVATLRCRAIMRKTLEPALHLVSPDFAERVVVNCITALCPLCGRTIALNKLGSLENWCKHLSLHGSIGDSLARRYRAFDKNAQIVDELHEIDQAVVLAWTALKPRPDAAPQNEDPRLCLPNRVPMNSSINWEVLVYSQLLNEGAFDYRSIVSQELMAAGFQAYGIPFHGPTHLAVLTDMQSRLEVVSGNALAAYLGETEVHHVNVLKTKRLSGQNDALKTENKDAQEDKSDGAVACASSSSSSSSSTALTSPCPSVSLRGMDALSRAIWCARYLVSERSRQIAQVVKDCYKGIDVDGKVTVDYATIEERLDELDRVESASTALPMVRARDAFRLVCTRRRQIADHALCEIFPDDVERTRYGARIAINSMVVVCPFCEKHYFAETFALDHAGYLEHLRTCTVNPAATKAFAARLVAFGTNAEDLVCPSLLGTCTKADFFPSVPPGPGVLRNDTLPPPRADVALSASNVDANLALRMDWSALMFEALMRAGVLSGKSVLTQEIVALGLFFFGLVNQRSPQKFGQYPQLHSFQVALHRAGPQGYDEYCGLGIRDQHLGSSHIRGRPVAVTSSILRAYRHLGLSAKSLKRFAASSSRQRRSAPSSSSSTSSPSS